MMHGLEARACRCGTLLVRHKVRACSLRHLQKRLCRRYLPPEVLARKKQGFVSVLPYLLKHEYQAMVDVLLRDSRLAAHGCPRQAGGPVDHGNRLWLLLNAETWYRMRILGHSWGWAADTLQACRPVPLASAA